MRRDTMRPIAISSAAGIAEHDGVAVRRASGDLAGADGSAGAGAVLDDDLLSQRFGHAVGGVGARREPAHRATRSRRFDGRRQGAGDRPRPGASLDGPARAGLPDNLVTPGHAVRWLG